MRRFLATTAAAAALVAAGCGEDNARDAQGQPEKTADATQTATKQIDVKGLAAETDKLANQVAAAARELAKDPGADVDSQLESARQRADELSAQAQDQAGDQPKLTSALREANERLAAAASDLRDAKDAGDVRAVLEQQLGPVAARLGDAFDEAEQSTGKDTRQQLQRARDTIDDLRDDIGR